MSNKFNKFRLELIIGPMFSGKSTELLRRVSCCKSIGMKALLINHTNDIRTTNYVKTHNGQQEDAIKTKHLMSLVNNDKFKNANVIGIDEGQFFDDLKEFILKIENLPKTIYISGLDGDYQRNPMGQILDCIPLCDKLDKLNSLDMMSKDGSAGIFTKRIVNSNESVLIGAKESYLSVNRENYFKNFI